MSDITVSLTIDSFMAANTADEALAVLGLPAPAAATYARFLAHIRAARAFDPYLPGADGEGTLTNTATKDVTLTKSYRCDVAEAIALHPYGRPQIESGTYIRAKSYTLTAFGTPDVNTSVCAIEFWTDAAKLQLELLYNQGNPTAVIVDGRYIASSGAISYASHTNFTDYVTVTFASAKLRRVRIESPGSGIVRDICVAAADIVFSASNMPTIAVVGDSVGEGYDSADGSTSAARMHGYQFALSKMLGVRSAGSSYSGTGYLNCYPQTGTQAGYRDRLSRDLSGLTLDLIIIQGSTNDPSAPGYAVAALQAEAQATWTAYRAAYPTTPIVITSSPGSIQNATLATMNAGLKTQFDTWADTNSLWVDLYTSTVSTSRYNIGGSHPAKGGHLFIARLLQKAILNWFQTKE